MKKTFIIPRNLRTRAQKRTDAHPGLRRHLGHDREPISCFLKVGPGRRQTVLPQADAAESLRRAGEHRAPPLDQEGRRRRRYYRNSGLYL